MEIVYIFKKLLDFENLSNKVELNYECELRDNYTYIETLNIRYNSKYDVKVQNIIKILSLEKFKSNYSKEIIMTSDTNETYDFIVGENFIL